MQTTLPENILFWADYISRKHIIMGHLMQTTLAENILFWAIPCRLHYQKTYYYGPSHADYITRKHIILGRLHYQKTHYYGPSHADYITRKHIILDHPMQTTLPENILLWAIPCRLHYQKTYYIYG